MSIFDFKVPEINIPVKTMGGKVLWNNLDTKQGYTLQKHKIASIYRILNTRNVQIAWSESEGAIRAKFISLVGDHINPKRGDIIGVHRKGGIYDHYGIYESDDCIYEYAAPSGDFSISQITIHITTLEKFIGDSNNCFVLAFPEKYGKPGKVTFLKSFTSPTFMSSPQMRGKIILEMIIQLNELRKMKNYKLYSADETIERAKKRLDEKSYNLIFNNCEHYAIWCKTGIKESHQVNNLLKAFSKV